MNYLFCFLFLFLLYSDELSLMPDYSDTMSF